MVNVVDGRRSSAGFRLTIWRLLAASLIATATASIGLAAPANAKAETCLGADETVTGPELLPAAERTLLCLVNLHRQAAGVAPLALEPSLAQSASMHSRNMVARDFFDHIDPETGFDPEYRARAAGYAGPVGENIGFSSTTATPRRVFNLWKESPGHDANMVDADYTVAGMGFAIGWPDELAGDPEDGLTGTQAFGVDPTGATDTALDLVVSERCAEAHALVPPLEDALATAKAAQRRAEDKVSERRAQLADAKGKDETDKAESRLDEAKAALAEAETASRRAADDLANATGRSDRACAKSATRRP